MAPDWTMIVTALSYDIAHFSSHGSVLRKGLFQSHELIRFYEDKLRQWRVAAQTELRGVVVAATPASHGNQVTRVKIQPRNIRPSVMTGRQILPPFSLWLCNSGRRLEYIRRLGKQTHVSTLRKLPSRLGPMSARTRRESAAFQPVRYSSLD